MIKILKKISKRSDVIKKNIDKNKQKTVVGFYEDVIIKGLLIRAKVDTGASRSSIDSGLADFLKLGPIIERRAVISSHGRGIRPIIETEIKIFDRKFKASFNIASRHHLRYPLLIGKNILRKGFIIDPSKKLKKQKRKVIKNRKDLHDLK